MSPFFRLAFVLAFPLGIAACFVDSSSNGSGYSSGGSGGTPGTTPSGGDGSPSAHPILAAVDTDQTMDVKGGQGVGVFTEYATGGHWHVWWTCDTLVNPQGAPCAFAVKISVAAGHTITNVMQRQFAATDTLAASPTEIDAATTTSTNFDEVFFDTAPGDTIDLSATVAGLYDGRFIFFVQKTAQGPQINGGTQGVVTDPIQLVPTSP